jgi:hypothetical protein
MSGFIPERRYTIGFHPSARGFGWIAFEGPFSPKDWGLFVATGDKNLSCVRKLEALFDLLPPETFVIEAFDKESSLRSERIRVLCECAVELASSRGAVVHVFSRGQIRACFATVGARTRDEIAAAVVRQVPALAPRLPKPRAVGDSEDRRLSLFGAASLVVTYYHDGALQVFDDLRDAA